MRKDYTAGQIIKTATKANKLTAQLLTELHGACTRILMHPDTIDFMCGEWAELCKTFKDVFGHVLPETEPENRAHLQQTVDESD